MLAASVVSPEGGEVVVVKGGLGGEPIAQERCRIKVRGEQSVCPKLRCDAVVALLSSEEGGRRGRERRREGREKARRLRAREANAIRLPGGAGVL